MVGSTLITIIGVPYNASLNSNEDLWLFAIIEVLTSIFKLGIIFIFKYCNDSPLIEYTLWMLVLTGLNTLLKFCWCRHQYDECEKLDLSYRHNKSMIHEMLGFTCWNAFGSIAVVGRNQGIAVLLNVFWGTVVNAVYGIANQVNGQLIYFSQMLTTSMTPQITKSRGSGNFNQMMYLAILTSKLTFFLSAIFAIPLIIEIDYVLKIWLGTPPENTSLYCTLIVYVFLIMELYPGLNRAIIAYGEIGRYQVVTSILLLLPIPFGIILFKCGYRDYYILYLMIACQILQLIVTVQMLYVKVKFNVAKYYIFVMKSILAYFIVYFIGVALKHQLANMPQFIQFILVCGCTMTLFSGIYFYTILSKIERNSFIATVKRIMH